MCQHVNHSDGKPQSRGSLSMDESSEVEAVHASADVQQQPSAHCQGQALA